MVSNEYRGETLSKKNHPITYRDFGVHIPPTNKLVSPFAYPGQAEPERYHCYIQADTHWVQHPRACCLR